VLPPWLSAGLSAGGGSVGIAEPLRGLEDAVRQAGHRADDATSGGHATGTPRASARPGTAFRSGVPPDHGRGAGRLDGGSATLRRRGRCSWHGGA
jgi:hypothetical protein